MKALLLSLCLFVFSQSLFAQTYDPSAIRPKAIAMYEKALDKLKDEGVQEAIPLFMQAVLIDTNYVDALLSLAGAYGELKQYQQSVTLYEKAKTKDPAYFNVYHLPYSINLAGLGRFQEALDAVTIFANIPRISERGVKSAAYRMRNYTFALDYAAKHPGLSQTFSPVNLGDSVNTEKAEYYPSVTVTDSMLVYTRMTGSQREDFIESRMGKNGFRAGKLIRGDINLEPKKGAISSSQDGEWLLYSAILSEQGFGNQDIYLSYQTPQGWSDPENLGANINTEFWESAPTLSPDKRVLYFSSNRAGGLGGKDLYVSYRLPNGKWGPAQNMGTPINSAGDDQAPFIHADNQTLYYTSDGLPGYGGTDLYLIRKGPTGNWSAPENLGYPINTIEHEGSLAVSADGLTAYYASDRSDTRGALDLYRFDLRPDIRPYRTLYVKGIVRDVQTNKNIPATVALTDNSNNQVLMQIQTDEAGEYLITLPTGKDYTFTVNRKGYLFYSQLYALRDQPADSVYQKNIYLQPIALNASFTFNNIEFASNAYQLPSAAAIELEKLVQVLQENPSLKVEISGHTDNIGKAEDNQLLSTNRAKAIVNYLLTKGIAATRLTHKGYAATKPLADNNTEAGRAQNRRTSFTITGL